MGEEERELGRGWEARLQESYRQKVWGPQCWGPLELQGGCRD